MNLSFRRLVVAAFLPLLSPRAFAADHSLYASQDPLSQAVLTGSIKVKGEPWVTAQKIDPAAAGRPGLPFVAVQGTGLPADLRDAPAGVPAILALPGTVIPEQPVLPMAVAPEKQKKQSSQLPRPPRGGSAKWPPRALEQLKIMSGGKVRVSFYDAADPPRRK